MKEKQIKTLEKILLVLDEIIVLLTTIRKLAPKLLKPKWDKHIETLRKLRGKLFVIIIWSRPAPNESDKSTENQSLN